MSNWKIFTIAGGFYFFGEEVAAPSGYIACTKCAMFRRFEGGKGLPGVARGDKDAIVYLDTFDEKEEVYFPLSNVYAILPSVNLYEFKGAFVNA
ncbi:MAG: hypothetical protein FWC69_06530 [Defluviitaleaceae bacterium]|nr:hypothetical protein [Defluviitaleaceae bacterium]